MLKFDLRYLNDISFVVDKSLIPVMQFGIGSGMLTTDYGFGANFAKTCWLIDNCIIQFSSHDKNMYIYDMDTKEIINHELSSLTTEEAKWMAECSKHSNDILLRIEKLKNEPKSPRQEAIANMYEAYFNIIYCKLSSLVSKERLDALEEHLNYLNYNLYTEFKDGYFYKDGNKLSYGEISRSITNLIKGE